MSSERKCKCEQRITRARLNSDSGICPDCNKPLELLISEKSAAHDQSSSPQHKWQHNQSEQKEYINKIGRSEGVIKKHTPLEIDVIIQNPTEEQNQNLIYDNIEEITEA